MNSMKTFAALVASTLLLGASPLVWAGDTDVQTGVRLRSGGATVDLSYAKHRGGDGHIDVRVSARDRGDRDRRGRDGARRPEGRQRGQGYDNRSRPRRGVDKAPTRRGVDKAPARRGVDKAPARRGVDKAPARRGVDKAPARRGVDKAPARRGVDKAPARRGVDKAPARRGRGPAHSPAPNRPHREKASPRRGHESSPQKRHYDPAPTRRHHDQVAPRRKYREPAHRQRHVEPRHGRHYRPSLHWHHYESYRSHGYVSFRIYIGGETQPEHSAWLLLAKGKLGRARILFGRASAYDPGRASPQFGYAIASARLGYDYDASMAMRSAFAGDMQSLRYVRDYPGLHRQFDRLADRLRYEMHEYGETPDRLVLLAGVEILRNDEYAAMEAAQRAQELGDDSYGVERVLRYLRH